MRLRAPVKAACAPPLAVAGWVIPEDFCLGIKEPDMLTPQATSAERCCGQAGTQVYRSSR